MSYIFNKITVRPQLPKRINKLYDISYNLWWSWNTEFLKLFKILDIKTDIQRLINTPTNR